MARATRTKTEPAPAPQARGRDGRRTASAINEAAVDLFFRHGYEATTLRMVASDVGIQVGSLYNHIAGKDELLTTIMTEVIEDLLRALDEAVAGAKDSRAALLAAIDCHIRFHANHRRETFIGNSELRSLDHDARDKVLGLRRQYELSLRELVTAAAAEARVELLDVRLQVFSILALGTHIASWFHPSHGDLDHVVDVYTTLVFRELAIPLPRGRRR